MMYGASASSFNMDSGLKKIKKRVFLQMSPRGQNYVNDKNEVVCDRNEAGPMGGAA